MTRDKEQSEPGAYQPPKEVRDFLEEYNQLCKKYSLQIKNKQITEFTGDYIRYIGLDGFYELEEE